MNKYGIKSLDIKIWREMTRRETGCTVFDWHWQSGTDVNEIKAAIFVPPKKMGQRLALDLSSVQKT